MATPAQLTVTLAAASLLIAGGLAGCGSSGGSDGGASSTPAASTLASTKATATAARSASDPAKTGKPTQCPSTEQQVAAKKAGAAAYDAMKRANPGCRFR